MPFRRALAVFAFLAAAATAAAQPLPPGITPELVDRARELLRSVPFADGHNDLPSSLLDVVRGDLDAPGADLNQVQMELPADIPRLREGGVGMQFWSAFVDTDFIATGDSLRQAIREIDVIHRFVDRYEDFEFALTADEIERAHAAGRIASMIGLEGGHAIEGSTAALRMFYELGVRYMTLTHFRTHDWADAATDIPLHRGLSPFGEEVIREMNRLGMFVDLSHVSAETMRDALRISEAPVLYSHSGARGVNAHPRNVPDDVLRLLPANGGVVMMDFIPGYVVPTPPAWLAREGIEAEEDRAAMGMGAAEPVWGALRHRERERLRAELDDEGEVIRLLSRWEADNPMPRGTVSDVAAHIEHIRDVAGLAHIGIGSDYYDPGGPSMVEGLEHVDRFPVLFAELLRRGWSEDDLRQIAAGNVLRALQGGGTGRGGAPGDAVPVHRRPAGGRGPVGSFAVGRQPRLADLFGSLRCNGGSTPMTPEHMARIRFGLPPDHSWNASDKAARLLRCSRAEIIRRAVGSHLEDFDDLTVAAERLRDPGDPVLDWDHVKAGPLAPG